MTSLNRITQCTENWSSWGGGGWGKDYWRAIHGNPLARDLFERREMDQGASSQGLVLRIYFEVGDSRT